MHPEQNGKRKDNTPSGIFYTRHSLTIKILHKEEIGVVFLDLTSVKLFCCLCSSFSKPGSSHPLLASYGNKALSFIAITLRQIVSF